MIRRINVVWDLQWFFHADTSKNDLSLTSTSSTVYLMYFSGFLVNGKLRYLQTKETRKILKQNETSYHFFFQIWILAILSYGKNSIRCALKKFL